MRRLHIFISHPSQYLTDCESHGDGLLAYEFVRRLGERGHELHVAVPAMRLQGDLPPTIHLYPVRSWTNGAETAEPSVVHRLEYAIRVRHLLRHLRRDIPFDLIHQLNPVMRGMSSMLSGWGLPIVLGPLPAPGALPLEEGMGRRLNRAILRAQIRRAALVLVPNAASLPLIPEDAESRAKVCEVPFGVDTALFHPEKREPQRPNVLFLANLKETKGALFLIDSFEGIAEKHPECVLTIAGGGPEEKALRERASRSPVASRIHFPGKVPREQVRKCLQEATVYCLPSSYEAFGMTALEAMACGKPVIGTDVGGLGLLVGATSPPVRYGDREAMCGALDGLLSSPELRARLGEENRRIAVARYDWDGVIDRLEGAYEGLLSRAPADLRTAYLSSAV